MDKSYALIENDVVVNIVVWDGDETRWSPPEGTIAIDVEGKSVGIGFTYDKMSGQFTNPYPSVEEIITP